MTMSENYRTIGIKVMMNEEEKRQIESNAAGKPLSVYLREQALGTGASASFPYLTLLVSKFKDDEEFRDLLFRFLQVNTESQVAEVLKRGTAIPRSPFYGYTVVELFAEDPTYVAYLNPPGSKQRVVVTPAHPDFSHLMSPDRRWLYRAGDTITS